MMRRMLLVAMGLASVTLVTALYAQTAGQPSPQPTPPDLSKNKDKLTLEEKKLAEKFNVFMQQLIQLKDKLDKGTPEDKAVAKVLQQVIDRSKSKSIDVQFQELVDFMKNDKLSKLDKIKEAAQKSDALTKDLQDLLALIRQDKSLADLQAERAKLEALAKKLEDIILKEKILQSQTHNAAITKGKDAKGLEGDQSNIAKKTGDVAKSLDGDKSGDGKGGEAEIAKSSSKSSDKGEGNKSDGKGEAKAGDGKGTDGKKGTDGGDGKQGTAKSGEGQENKSGDGKGDPGKGKDAGKGGEKSGQGDAKGGDKSGMGGDKAGDKKGDGQPGGMGDPKAGGSKGDGAKSGMGGAKPGDKASDSKGGGQGKGGGEPKAGQGGSKGGGDAKGGQGGAKGGGDKGHMPMPMNPNDKGNDKAAPKNASKGDQGQAKGGDKGDQGGAKGAGQPKQGGSQGGDKKGGDGSAKGGGGQPKEGGGGGGGGGGGKKDDGQDQQQQVKKQIQDAEHYMKKAEKELAKNKPEDAVPEQGKAIDELEKAKKKLEDLLKQLREEEIERLLAALQVRCEHMLIMQIEVRDGTVSIGESVKKNNNKVSNLHKNDALKQSDKEKEIVNEATKAIELLEAEGSAVAFPEVFKQIRVDMKDVAKRLEGADVGEITVAIENDIIKTLEEMIDALKKAREENKDKKKKGKPGKGGGGKGDQKLMELVQELKMIKSMQLKINNRTNIYGKSEQANEPEIQKQLQDLSERQEKLFDVTRKLFKGENK